MEDDNYFIGYLLKLKNMFIRFNSPSSGCTDKGIGKYELEAKTQFLCPNLYCLLAASAVGMTFTAQSKIYVEYPLDIYFPRCDKGAKSCE